MHVSHSSKASIKGTLMPLGSDEPSACIFIFLEALSITFAIISLGTAEASSSPKY